MADLLLVLGGGLLGGTTLPPWSIARLDAAVRRRRDEPIMVLSAGTPHRPPHAVTEARAGARYLLSQGVPRTAILEENLSYDTIGNAFFARLLHTAPRPDWRRLHVITSEFHLPRSRAAFEWVFQAEGADKGYQLTFEGTPNTGLAPAALAAREAKEAAAVSVLQSRSEQYRTLAAIHEWLFTEHEAYAVGLAPSPVTDAALLESY